MGRLINREKLKRAKENRAVRKQQIFELARSTFARMPYVEVTLDTIGQKADVDRGIASMYFRTREELFLLLLRDELAEWFTALESEFSGCNGEMSIDRLAELIARSLGERPVLTRFLSVMPVVLEQNVELMEVFRFQRWRRDRIVEIGEAIEKVFPDLAAGDGFKVLYLAQLLVTGLEPAANPRGSAAFEKGDPDYAGFWIDLAKELERILRAVLKAGI